jgi:hypothetical protein
MPTPAVKVLVQPPRRTAIARPPAAKGGAGGPNPQPRS